MINPITIAAVAVGAAALAVGAYFLGRDADADEEEVHEELPYGELASRADFDDLKAEFEELVAAVEKDKTATPQYMEMLSAAFKAKGYDLTGSRLASGARERLDKLGGWPYKIQKGDIASAIAQTHSGDANRWRELVGRTTSDGKRLVKYIGPKGYEQLKPWRAGLIIMLPLDWTNAPQLLTPASSYGPKAKTKAPSTDWAKL